MAEPVAIQKFVDADLDVDTLEAAVNEDKIITARLGREYASVPMASRLLVENGLLGARPFSTYEKMTAADVDPPLVDGDYAVVTNDADLSKTGVYLKVSGIWERQKYNNPSLAALYTDERIKDSQAVKYDFYTSDVVPDFFVLSANNKILKTGEENQLENDFYTKNNQQQYVLIDNNNKIINPSNADITIAENLLDAKFDGELYKDTGYIRERDSYLDMHYVTNSVAIPDGINSVYAFYDQLMTVVPDYITKDTLATDVDGNPIHEYKFSPPLPHYWGGTPIEDAKPVKIVIVSGTHGAEYAGIIAVMTMMSNLVNKWRDLERYDVLRYGVEFVVVPCAVPYGVINMTRGNKNGVDINRNFPVGWVAIPQGDLNYSGTSGGSELETQTLMSLATRHPDADFFLDIHQANEPTYLYWIGADRADTKPLALKTMHQVTAYAYKYMDIIPTDNTRLPRFAVPTDGGYVRYNSAVEGGNKPTILYETAHATHAMIGGDWFKARCLNENGLVTMATNVYNLIMQKKGA